MVEWRDIASAPKDGVVLLASMTVRDAGKGPEWSIVAGYWDAEFEYDNDEYRGAWTDDSVASWGYEERTELHPTHWMPLPPAPGTPTPDGTGSGEAIGIGEADEDWLTDVINDSIDMDWTGSIGAKAIIHALRKRNQEIRARQICSVCGTIGDADHKGYCSESI